jgi:SAM-dependent methyltransferase
VTGVDFSPTALSRLAALAEACHVTVATVEADSRRLPARLEDSFDLVFASVGVLGWIDDLDAWMGSVARVLRPGGHLVLVEIHPMLQMVATPEPLVIDFPYNFDGSHHFSGQGSYANREADFTWTTVEYAHGVAEVVMAARRAGLDLEHLAEHLDAAFDPRGLGLEADGRFRLRLGRGPKGEAPDPVPVLYTLVVRRSED